MPEAVTFCRGIGEYCVTEGGISSGKVSSVVVVLIPEATGEKLSNRGHFFTDDFLRLLPLATDESKKAMFQQLGMNWNQASGLPVF